MTDSSAGRLRDLLAADAGLIGDSGGKAPALARTGTGPDNVARLLAAAFPPLADRPAGPA